MQAAVLHHLGEVPRFESFADPAVLVGEVLVRVAAAAIKPLDLVIAGGRHHRSPLTLPSVCGTDGVGYMETGERVYFTGMRAPFGAMATFAPAQCVAMIPDDIDNLTAAAIVSPALAVWLPLRWRADVRPGETVLIVGATGALGRMAVQAARSLGAGRVIAAGRRQDVLARLGADAIIDLRLPPTSLHEAFASHAVDGIDVVIDFVWGPIAEVLIAALTTSVGHGQRGVRMVSTGDMAGDMIALSGASLRDSPVALMGSGPGNGPSSRELESMIETILKHAADGALRIDADMVPLADVAQVWERAAGRERPIVLKVG